MLLQIDGLSHDGKGLARIAGKVAFVPGALPGETVEAVLHQRRARFDDYRLLKVVEPSSSRAKPECPLVGECGGCDLQHLDGGAQLQHKTDAVLNLLARQAGLAPTELEEPILSAPYGYRQRARLAVFTPRRRGGPVLGFREGGGSRVVGVDRCPVLAAPLTSLPGRLQRALAALEQTADLGHVELYVAESSDGRLRPVIYLRTVALLPPGDLARLVDFSRETDAYLALRAGDAPLTYLHRPVEEAPAYELPALDLRISFEPGDFLQGNAAVNRQLVNRLLAWAGEPGERRVLDAFAGLGNFSLALARRGFPVLGLEVGAEMVGRARANAGANGLRDVTFMVRDLLQDDQAVRRQAFDLAVLDPPRAGARALVSELAARACPQILYVSCSPATLARDAGVLAGAGYELARLCLVDMFPQTSHVETMALFVRPHRRR